MVGLRLEHEFPSRGQRHIQVGTGFHDVEIGYHRIHEEAVVLSLKGLSEVAVVPKVLDAVVAAALDVAASVGGNGEVEQCGLTACLKS